MINKDARELDDSDFSLGELYKRVEEYALLNEYKYTLRALNLMAKYHDGAIRKGPGDIPYIIHPLTLSAHAIALGIADDEVLATCLLHDVLEDTIATVDDLAMPDEINEAVQLVTFEKNYDCSKDEAKMIYFERISHNRIAIMVKVLDRCNNISNMSKAFGNNKMMKYIDETYKYILPLIDILKSDYPEYDNACFALKYQMLGILESIQKFL